MLFRNKYRELFATAAAELEATQNQLQVERAKRISAETIAEERRQQLERTWEQVHAAESERKEAVGERLKSLDLVNTHLLGAMAPEQKPPDIKQWKQISKPRQQAVSFARMQDRLFMTSLLDGSFLKKKNVKEATPNTDAEPSIQ